jgi:hypothetical protein
VTAKKGAEGLCQWVESCQLMGLTEIHGAPCGWQNNGPKGVLSVISGTCENVTSHNQRRLCTSDYVKTLEMDPALLGWAKFAQKSERRSQERARVDVTMEAEVGVMWGHEPRNAGTL